MQFRSLKVLSISIAMVLLTGCSAPVIRANLLASPHPVPSTISITDTRPYKGIELHGVTMGSDVPEIQTTPTVAQAIAAELAGRRMDVAKVTVVRASCEISNQVTTSSASLEVDLDVQGRVFTRGARESFGLTMGGAPFQTWCPAKFMIATRELAADIEGYLGGRPY